LDRRTFAAGSAALLSGCATVGTRHLGECTRLAPVDADPSRLIRSVAGLRPYRRPGFVVRAEALGEKRLVHNYGHGGGGITLSWGSSKLATDRSPLLVAELFGKQQRDSRAKHRARAGNETDLRNGDFVLFHLLFHSF